MFSGGCFIERIKSLSYVKGITFFTFILVFIFSVGDTSQTRDSSRGILESIGLKIFQGKRFKTVVQFAFCSGVINVIGG